jgi:hypothetical protein
MGTPGRENGVSPFGSSNDPAKQTLVQQADARVLAGNGLRERSPNLKEVPHSYGVTSL